MVSATPVKVDEEPFSSLDPNLSLTSMVSVYRLVLTFIDKLKMKWKPKDFHMYEHFSTFSNEEISLKAYNLIIVSDQRHYFPGVFDYFRCKNPSVKDMPRLVNQLHLFIDDFGLIRVKCKFAKWKDGTKEFPILLAKGSKQTQRIILEHHRKKLTQEFTLH